MHTTAQTSRNGSVDAFRILAALFIIVLHLRFPGAPSDVAVGLRLMSRWAIPFFFIVSGYFLAVKHSKTGKLDVLSTVERLIWMFLLWILIYIPFFVSQHDLPTLLKLVVAPAFAFFGIFTHLWFLPSLIFGYLFISFCHRYNVKFLLPIFSIISLVAALISGAYNIFDFGFPLDYENARIWLCIPFLYIGFLLHQKWRPNWWLSALLIISGVGLQIYEAKYLYVWYEFSAYEHQFLIGTIPFAIGMAGLALNNLKFLQHPLISHWGGEYSLGIYLLHPAAIFIVSPWLARQAPGLARSAVWQVAYPLVILIICLTVLSLLKRFLPSVYNILFGSHIAPA